MYVLEKGGTRDESIIVKNHFLFEIWIEIKMDGGGDISTGEVQPIEHSASILIHKPSLRTQIAKQTFIRFLQDFCFDYIKKL